MQVSKTSKGQDNDRMLSWSYILLRLCLHQILQAEVKTFMWYYLKDFFEVITG